MLTPEEKSALEKLTLQLDSVTLSSDVVLGLLEEIGEYSDFLKDIFEHVVIEKRAVQTDHGLKWIKGETKCIKPKDVREWAFNRAFRLYRPVDNPATILVLARALQAERAETIERCARVAESDYTIQHSGYIANKIRKLDHEE